MSRSDWSLPTQLAHLGRDPDAHFGSVNIPPYRASTILKPTLAAWNEAHKPDYKGLTYGRSGTATTRAFEASVAALYGAETSVAVGSGMGALALAILTLTKAGDHVLVTDGVYYPCRRFCDNVLPRYGVSVTYYDPLIGSGIAELMRPGTSLVITEAPSSLTFEIQDIPAITAAAHAGGAKVMIDNTWATAIGFNPFAHGVDVVAEAATKYISGHSDVMIGVVVANGKIGADLRAMSRSLGHCVGGDDLYLAQRGLRTLDLRLRRCGESGLTVASWLSEQPEVRRVLHPALPGDPGHALWKRDFKATSGLFAIVLDQLSPEALATFVDGLELFGIGASWGGYESLAMPAEPATSRTATSWDEKGTVLRFHIGLENPADLIADLEAGFRRIRRNA